MYELLLVAINVRCYRRIMHFHTSLVKEYSGLFFQKVSLFGILKGKRALPRILTDRTNLKIGPDRLLFLHLYL